MQGIDKTSWKPIYIFCFLRNDYRNVMETEICSKIEGNVWAKVRTPSDSAKFYMFFFKEMRVKSP